MVCLTAFGQGYMKAEGKKIIDNRGQEIILKGMGLGGWMLQEPYMLNLSGAAVAQYDIRKKITKLIGKKNTTQFYEAWLSNHCTKADIDSLASWGFNSVRLPMHYNLYTLPLEKEPVKNKNTWLTKGFELTDSLLSWCEENQIYLILDLHAAPGGQGNDFAISDRDSTTASLWDSPANQNKTIALWKKLAQRYSGKNWIGGYDLINEPNYGFTDKTDKHGCAEQENKPLKELYQKITAAIRQVDKNHMIFIEGNCWANNYNGLFPLWDNNMVVSFHKYWNFNTQGSIENSLSLREKYNVPLWLGETGENSNDWFTNVVALMERNNIGWNMWPLKKSGSNNPLQVVINENALKVMNYLKGNGNKPTKEEAFTGLMQLATDTRNEKNIYHNNVTAAMIKLVLDKNSRPYSSNVLGDTTIVYAADYDLGIAGKAYHDVDSAEYWVSTNVRTPWNKGGQYRNDGVDIERCSDVITNGYNVAWIEQGEWLQYSVYMDKDQSFDVNLRYAAPEKPGRVKLILGDAFVSGENLLPATGGNQAWETHTIKNIKMNKGWNRVRVLATQGGFNLNYLQFLRTGDTVKND